MNYSKRSLSFQLGFGIAVLCILVIGGVSIWSNKASERAAIEDVKIKLAQDAKMLSAFVESVYLGELSSADRLMNVFESVIGGSISLGHEMVKTGKFLLPVVMANGRVLNGNSDIINEMESRIGKAGIGLQIIHNDKVHRILTANKDADGNYLFGDVVPDSDPLAIAAKNGLPWRGLVIRDGKARATVAKPIFDKSGKPIGILAITLDVEKAISRLSEKIGGIKVGETGYVYALAPSKDGGKFVIHPSLIGKDINEVPENARIILKEILQRDHGTVEYLWPDGNGKDSVKIVGFHEVPGLGWKVVTGSFVNEFVARVSRQAVLSMAVMFVGLIFIVFIIVLIIRSRLSPVKNLISSFEKIGSGDLTVSIVSGSASSASEIDKLSSHAVETVSRIRDVVSAAKRASENVAMASIQSCRAASDADKIASKLGEQAHAMASSVEQVSVSIDQVADHSKHVSQMTELVSASAKRGVVDAENFQTDLHEVSSQIRLTAETIEKLGERSKEIGNIVKVIQDIAGQTNLLALNAAIEAARAGETGRGFAVVADEVRKLADNTSRSADEIQGVVSSIQSETNVAVESIAVITREVICTTSKANEICESLKEISNKAHKSAESVSGISDATREQSSAVQEIAQGVEQIARLSQESAHYSSESLRITQIMGNLAKKLDESMKIFKA